MRPAGGLDPACCEAASKVTSWSDWDRLLGGGDSDGSTGIGCNKILSNWLKMIILETTHNIWSVDSVVIHPTELCSVQLTSQNDPKWFPLFASVNTINPTNINSISNIYTNTWSILITCDTGSMPMRILLALSASFSQARARSCSASTEVR